jgi:hypothetical protein
MPKVLDRVVRRIAAGYEARGVEPEEAERRAWATVVKRGWAKREDGHMALTEKGRETLDKGG